MALIANGQLRAKRFAPEIWKLNGKVFSCVLYAGLDASSSAWGIAKVKHLIKSMTPLSLVCLRMTSQSKRSRNISNSSLMQGLKLTSKRTKCCDFESKAVLCVCVCVCVCVHACACKSRCLNVDVRDYHSQSPSNIHSTLVADGWDLRLGSQQE